MLAGNPFQKEATIGSKMLVLFLSDDLDPTLLEAHDPTELAPQQIRVGERAIYQWCPDGFLAAPSVERCAVGEPARTDLTKDSYRCSGVIRAVTA